MSEDITQVPRWVRILDILIGIVGILLSVFVLIIILLPGFIFLFIPHAITITELMLVWIIGIDLILFGLPIIVKGFVIKEITTGSKVLYVIGGLLLIITGGLAYTYPILIESMILLLMSIGFIIYGFILVFRVYIYSKAVMGRKLVLILIGLIIIAVSITAVIFWSTWTMSLLLMFLGIESIISGMSRLIIGLIVEIY
ncbi:MAG: hypothetical protein ACFE8O_11920 [Candidatus Hermodarchaeota archaeon]